MSEQPRIDIESLSTPDLLNLLRNSRLKGNTVTAELVERILEARRSGLRPAAGDRAMPIRAPNGGAPMILRRGRPFAAAAALLGLSLFATRLGTDFQPVPAQKLILHEALTIEPRSPVSPPEPSREPSARVESTPSETVVAPSPQDPPAPRAETVVASVASNLPALRPADRRRDTESVLAMSTSPGLGAQACDDPDTSTTALCDDTDRTGRRVREGELAPQVRPTPLRHPTEELTGPH